MSTTLATVVTIIAMVTPTVSMLPRVTKVIKLRY
jgi:hypothetical protein